MNKLLLRQSTCNHNDFPLKISNIGQYRIVIYRLYPETLFCHVCRENPLLFITGSKYIANKDWAFANNRMSKTIK